MRRLGLAGMAVLALATAGCPAPQPDRPTPPEDTPTSPSPATTTTPAPTPTPSPGSEATATSPAPAQPPPLALETVASGLASPVFAAAPPGDRQRLFVAERAGTIRVLDLRTGEVAAEPFLDITSLTRTDGERGLLGFAFHPDYADNGRFVVHYSDARDGGTRIVEYRVSGDPRRADPDSARRLIAVEQPAANHNGGMVAFGADGMLYVGLGDGGAAGDRFGNGQDPSTLLGTVLRVDVDDRTGDRPYGIPPDNPFADGEGGAPEVWAYGLRNPWRFSFDRPAGLLYIGDVGQSAVEEVNAVAADEPGLNYGWPILEGSRCYDPPQDCDRAGLVEPVVDYPHDGQVCGVIGGYVYRGEAIPGLDGTYFYGDLCGGWIRSFRYRSSGQAAGVGGQVTDGRDHSEELGVLDGMWSFATDDAGEIYVLTPGGEVHRIAAADG